MSKHTVPIDALLARLREKYPDAKYELEWDTPLHLLVATILAAQCTDVRVNAVTKTLFPKYPDARAFAEADLEALEQDVKPTGTYRQKAKAIQEVCRAILERFDGEVPREMAQLTTLPRVARKTANVVLNTAWNVPSGVIVDTHVARVSYRMGLTDEDKPERIEQVLMKLVPQGDWTFFGPAMVLHGRYTCTARAPKCPECIVNDVCPKRIVE
jgi:endonuclease-3